ncbi:hypothetical protein KKD04_01610 [Patescibacteria group bacterium]|nr:hypothetical protein [Patescibacteria group bacterium]
MSKKPILIISDDKKRANKIKKEYKDKGKHSPIEISIVDNAQKAWQAMLDSPIVEIHFDPEAKFYKEIIS